MSERPAIPKPNVSAMSLLRTCEALKANVEILLGIRGSGTYRAWTAAEATAVAARKLLPLTLATLPEAASLPYFMVAVTDGAGNRPVVVSDGTVWRYADGTAV